MRVSIRRENFNSMSLQLHPLFYLIRPHSSHRQLYTVNPEQGSVTIIDAATNKEIGRVKEIGKTLSLIILSP